MREEYKTTISAAAHAGRSWVSIRTKLIENSDSRDVNNHKSLNEGTFCRRESIESGNAASPAIR
ncbi:hypothetical protein JCM14469_08430 [Desulfatiferula olefinivorans]